MKAGEIKLGRGGLCLLFFSTMGLCSELLGATGPFIGGVGTTYALSPSPSQASSPSKNLPSSARGRNVTQPSLFYADQIVYDRARGLWTASGHVEFAQEERVLEADELIYDEKTHQISARGHIRLREANGEVITADFVELTGDLKEGVLHEVRLLMVDKSRLAARKATRSEGGRKTIFQQAVYTPCYPCADDPQRSAFWQLNAREVIYDQGLNTVTSLDPHLKCLGIPFAYLPRLSFPTTRASGFLVPSFVASSVLGSALGVPYYWAINEKSDATFSPFVTLKKGPVLGTQWRYRAERVQLNLQGSGNQDKRFTGHLAGDIRVDLTEKWRLTADGTLLSQRSYFKTFRELPLFSSIWNAPFLTSSVKGERFSSHDYLSLTALSYRGLSETDSAFKTPFIAPGVTYHVTSNPLWMGSYVTYDGDVVSYSRPSSPHYQRMVNRLAWHRPYLSPLGYRLNLFGSVRGDVYNSHIPTRALSQTVGQQSFSGTVGRFFPQAGAEWRMPLVGRWLITEPVVQGIVAPHQGTARKIPNIDCLGFEFNDTVLFRHNRLPGYDQVDAGNRVTYGVTLLPTPAFLQTTRLFLGQTYAFGKPAGDLYSGGMTPKASDVVGSLQTDPHEWVSFDYRFRLSRRNLRPVFSEVFYGLGPSVFRLGTSYLRSSPSHASNSLQKQQPEVHQLSLSLSSKFHRDWSAEIVQLRNLHKKELLSQGARVVFQNECVSASMFIGRSYYRGGDIKPSTSFLFTVALKNLGGGTLKPGGNAEARRL